MILFEIIADIGIIIAILVAIQIVSLTLGFIVGLPLIFYEALRRYIKGEEE